MLNDYRGKSVLITGGTQGIGLASGLAFGSAGASVYLTHRWGSADEAQILERFKVIGAPEPVILEADASRDEDIEPVLARIHQHHERLDVFVSNVCVVMRGDGVEAHSRRALLKSLDYSSWPFVAYLHASKRVFGTYPMYAVATSSDGPDRHYPYYDYVAIAKTVLETFCRYMATHLHEEGCKINVVRTRQVITASYEQIFGSAQVAMASKFPEFAVTAEEVGRFVYALCSGLLDAMSGQVVMLDRGAQFVDNIMTLGSRLHESEPQ